MLRGGKPSAACARSRDCGTTTLRFILPEDEKAAPDAARDDVWLMRIAATGRRIYGKFLLQNAFFRKAAAAGDYHFVARLDDDAVVPLRAMTAGLAQIHKSTSVWDPVHVVVSDLDNWAMWDPQLFAPVCFDTNRNRRRQACSSRQKTDLSNSSKEDQCCRPRATGPFPFAGGGFVAYTIYLLRRLVSLPQLAFDEHAVVTRGSMEPTAGDGARRRSTKARALVLEDVYFASLLHGAFGNQSVTLVSIPSFHPPWWSSTWWRTRFQPSMMYHQLKTSYRWEDLRRNWSDLTNYSWGLRCETATKGFGAIHRYASAQLSPCCAQWQRCRFHRSSKHPRV